MTTQLFFHAAVPDWSRGQGDANLVGTVVNWTTRSLTPTRGSATTSPGINSVAGLTAGLEIQAAMDFVTEPLDRDITISGSINCNLWGLESSMNANAALGVIIDRLNSQGAVVSSGFGQGIATAELGTSSAVQNFNISSPTTTNFLKGDRIRVRVYFDDAPTLTMGSGFTLTFNYDGPTAAASGDSYITFTEDFGFLTVAPGGVLSYTSAPTNYQIGNIAASERRAQSFIAPNDGTLTGITLKLSKTSVPTDNFEVALQADSSGSPSGTDLTTASLAGGTITGTQTDYVLDVTDYALSGGSTYWIVARRSGALDGSNYYRLGLDDTGQYRGPFKTYNTGAWTANVFTAYFSMSITNTFSTLYLTDTASAVDPNGSSYDALEAWTSRGSGFLTAQTVTVTGPVSPQLLQQTGAGNFLEWFTKQLSAFTLSGLVACNIRGFESAGASANAAFRVEIAVCASDGTSPVVWGAATDGTELIASTETAMTFNIAGDDTAVTDGQRLRIRVFYDDAPGVATASGWNVSFRYAGTSAAASGDTYITLPQAVTEYSASGDVTVTPSTIAISASVPAPTVAVTANVTATPATVAVTTSVPAPTLRSSQTATPTTIAATVSVPSPTVRGTAISTPSVVAATASVPTPTLSGTATATPTTVTVTTAVPTPTAIGTIGGVDATATPATIAATVTVPSPTASGTAIASPAVVAAAASVPSPTTRGTALASPAAVAATVTVPSPTTRATAIASPAVVAVTTTVPAPTTSGAAIASPAVVAAVVAVPTPTIVTGGVFGQVTNLTAVAQSASSILLDWDDPDAIGHFQVERNSSILVPVSANLTATTYLDTACAPSTEYTYRVRAYTPF